MLSVELEKTIPRIEVDLAPLVLPNIAHNVSLTGLGLYSTNSQ